VQGEALRLRQVVDNLLGNAVAHTPDDARIAVTLRSVGDAVVLVVEDDGPGIPVDARESVFERFTRLDGSRARSTGGAGLGLSIVQSIVVAHGGSVRVDAAISGGARFVVTLPREPAPEFAGSATADSTARAQQTS
jgi:two-component system OmpR family sensor kinase